jgi:hypothetical protein
MVVFSTRKRELRGDQGNHHETLGLEKIWCASQLTIVAMAGNSRDPAGNITETGTSKPNQPSRTPDF